jgi:hypothetical protein
LLLQLWNTIIQYYNEYRCDSAISRVQSIGHILLLDGCLNYSTLFLYFSHDIVYTVIQRLLLLELLLACSWCIARYNSLVRNHFDMGVVSWNYWTNISWSFGSCRMVLGCCRFILDRNVLWILVWG